VGPVLGLRRCAGAKTTAPAPAPMPTPTGPQPKMPSIAGDCNKYYLVKSGDSCYTIEAAQKVTLPQLLAWNNYAVYELVAEVLYLHWGLVGGF
jgi:hypothetical protein